MIFINVSFIKSHNGLWFYSLNLIDSFVTRFGSSVIVVCNKSQYDLLSNNYDNVLILNFSTIFRYLSDSSNIFISTNMRPFLLPRSYFIIHDFWPLRQNNFIKKSISHLIFKIGMILVI